MAKPWERLENETKEAWEAFSQYRDLGVNRSLTVVAQGLSKSVPLLSRWSAKHNWQARVVAWDNEHQRVRDAAQLKAVAKVAEKTATKLELTAAKVLERQMQIAYADLTKAIQVHADGTVTVAPTAELDENTRAAIKSIETYIDESGTLRAKRIELHDPRNALNLLGQNQKLWGAKEDATTQNNLFAIFLDAAKSGELLESARRRGIDLTPPKVRDEDVIEVKTEEGED